MDKILTLNNVYYEKDSFKLTDLSFSLYEKDIVGLIGENGAGKTTLFRLIFNDLKPKSGEVVLFNKEVSTASKSDLGIILDRNHFNNYLTPNDLNRVFSNMFHNWDTKLFYEYLDSFEISANKSVGSLSNGMKVKLNFAYVFCRKPKLLLLDEATNGLDPIFRSTILTALKDFSEQTNCATIISSHILSDLEKVTNKVLYLKNGSLKESINNKKWKFKRKY